MAAPPEVTIKNLSGKFVMNKSLSDDSDSILSLQGVGWVVRKAISVATVTLHINHTPNGSPDGKADTIKIIQVLTGGIKGSTELRTLDFQKRGHTDHVFGDLEGRSRPLPNLSSLDTDILTHDANGNVDPEDVKFLRAEVLKDLTTPSKWLDAELWIQSYVENAASAWSGEQIWGFEEIDGKRLHTRRVIVRRNGQVLRARLVYDYIGKQELTD